MFTTTQIVSLIMALAPLYGVDPKVAVAVATVESGLKTSAIGGQGEIGLFQIMPRIAKAKGFNKKQLLDPVINTHVGLQMLHDSKNSCVHDRHLTWLICYNAGARNAKKIRHPDKFPYVTKVQKQLNRSIASCKKDTYARD